MEVSSFVECPYLPCFSGYISCLWRCPQFRGVLIEGPGICVAVSPDAIHEHVKTKQGVWARQ